MTDTIFALATAPGRGGIAIIRVSGPETETAVRAVTGTAMPTPRMAHYTRFFRPHTNEPLDDGVLLYFKAPASYTGEDVAELHCHGGQAIVKALLQALSSIEGLRLAEPGEFTRRAYENGKMDLTAAEAVADLIDAETELQRQQAFKQMGGALASLYNDWAERLKRSLAYLEAGIDFVDEEDVTDAALAVIRPDLEALEADIATHLNDNRRGERLRAGIRIAVIGAPNAGKSSLVNALAEREVAIVSAQAGTTRDVIEAHLNLGGYPVILSDTAGLRPDQIGSEGQQAIEQEGIRRALAVAEGADIQCLVFDESLLPEIDAHTLALYEAAAAAGEERRVLVVFNKADLAEAPPPCPVDFTGAVRVSAQIGSGLPALSAKLAQMAEDFIGSSETPSLTRERHRQALIRAHDSLTRALAASVPELLAEDLRLATRELGRITGRVDVEDLLDVIFRDFCLGK